MLGRKLKDKYTLLTTDYGRIPEWNIIGIIYLYMSTGVILSFVMIYITTTIIPQFNWFPVSIIIIIVSTVVGIYRITEPNTDVI